MARRQGPGNETTFLPVSQTSAVRRGDGSGVNRHWMEWEWRPVTLPVPPVKSHDLDCDHLRISLDQTRLVISGFYSYQSYQFRDFPIIRKRVLGRDEKMS